MVSIIIPLYNQLDYTKMCVESIQKHTPEPHEIVFVDNGSTDGTGEFLKEHWQPNWKMVVNEENRGYPVGCNQGMTVAEGDVFCILNNDVVVSKEWLGGMLNCLNMASDVGIVGPRTNFASGAQQVTLDGQHYSNPEEYEKFADAYRISHKGLYMPRWRIIGMCMVFKRELIDKVGHFDDLFTPGNFEDDDLCTRAFAAGYRNMICGDVFVHHFGSKSHDKEKYEALLKTNQDKFQKKWDGISGKTISACMIVKDEEECIATCLHHLEPVVDEIILVDTGSKDKTKEIATGFSKVKMYDFVWCDDFSAARNFAHSKATSDWLLSIDADECITGLDREKLWHPWTCFRVLTRNYTNNVKCVGWEANTGEYPHEGKWLGWFPSEKARIWPNDKRIVFEYPVHEVVEESIYYCGYRVVTDYSIIVHHYGRTKDNYEYGHGNKYYHLLHKQFESGKNDIRSLEQLATQAQGLHKYDEAQKFWDELLKLEPDNSTALLNKGHCYAQVHNWQDAKEWAYKAWKVNPITKEPAMNVAIIDYMLHNYDTAEEIATDLEQKYPNYPIPKSLLIAIRTAKANMIYTGGV